MRDLDRDTFALLRTLSDDNSQFVARLVRSLARDERLTEAAAEMGLEVEAVVPAAGDSVGSHVCDTCVEPLVGGECGCTGTLPAREGGDAS